MMEITPQIRFRGSERGKHAGEKGLNASAVSVT